MSQPATAIDTAIAMATIIISAMTGEIALIFFNFLPIFHHVIIGCKSI